MIILDEGNILFSTDLEKGSGSGPKLHFHSIQYKPNLGFPITRGLF